MMHISKRYFNSKRFKLQFKLKLYLKLLRSGKLYLNNNFNKIICTYSEFEKNTKCTKIDETYLLKQIRILDKIFDLIYETNYESKVLHIKNEDNSGKLSCVLCLGEFKKTGCHNSECEKVIICDNSFCDNGSKNSKQDKEVCQEARDINHHVMHVDCFNKLFKQVEQNCKRCNNDFKKVMNRQCLCCANSFNSSYTHRVIID